MKRARKRRKFRSGHRAGGGGGAGQPGLPLSRRFAGRGRFPRQRVCADRSGTGFAPFLLPLEYRPGRRTAEARGASQFTKPGALDAQVKRMMADPRASSLVTSFAVKWLNLDGLDSVKPDPAIFPGFNEQLRHDFLYEAEAFISSIFLEDRSVVDLLTADHTFLNDRLARHYGISGVVGSPVPRSHADRQRTLWHSGQGRGADADVVRRPHVAGAAGSMGARQADRHAAQSAAAERATEPFADGRRSAEDGPRAARAASRSRRPADSATA